MRSVVCAVFAVLFMTAVSQAAFAQQYPGAGPGPAIQGAEGKEIAPEQFNEMKARILKMIEERRAKLDQEKACVEAAKSADELRNCRPERPMGGGGRGGRFQGGPGGQRPPMAPGESSR